MTMRIPVLLTAALLPLASAHAQSSQVIAEIATQFDDRPLVMIGEYHRSREIHAHLQQMLRDPAFICKVDDITVIDDLLRQASQGDKGE